MATDCADWELLSSESYGYTWTVSTYIILFMDNVDCASKCVNCAQTFHNIQESGAMKNVVLKYLNIGS